MYWFPGLYLDPAEGAYNAPLDYLTELTVPVYH